MAGKALVDDADMRVGNIVLIGKNAAGEERYLHHLEIVGGDGGKLDVELLFGRRVVACDEDIAVLIAIGELGEVGGADGLDAGQACYGVEDPLMNGRGAFGRVAGEPGTDGEGDQG